MPYMEDATVVGHFERGYIDDIEIDGVTKRVLVADGYVDEMRYPKFVAWLKDRLEHGTVKGSVEIVGRPENENRIIYDGGYKEKGRIPQIYDYSGYAILGIRPADDTAIVMELNNKSQEHKEETGMDEKILGNRNTPSNPLANSFIAALPADLRAVMKSVTKYTDNTANGGGNQASYITATTDYLWLLAEFEVQGARTYANSYEQNYQAQYQYFKSGNSKVAYKYNATGTAVYWWLRSAYYYPTNRFCIVYTDGSASRDCAYYSLALLPGFAV